VLCAIFNAKMQMLQLPRGKETETVLK